MNQNLPSIMHKRHAKCSKLLLAVFTTVFQVKFWLQRAQNPLSNAKSPWVLIKRTNHCRWNETPGSMMDYLPITIFPRNVITRGTSNSGVSGRHAILCRRCVGFCEWWVRSLFLWGRWFSLYLSFMSIVGMSLFAEGTHLLCNLWRALKVIHDA